MSEFINNQSIEKQEALKALIKRLHDGEDKEVVKEAFKASFSDVSTAEISAIEQALIDEGLPVKEVQRLCDVHASVFGGSISDIHHTDAVKTLGHPLQVLSEENRRIEQLIEEEIMPYLETEGNMSLLMLRVGMDRLKEIDRHYARKEQLFFPYLEKKGVSGPPQVMWGVDDEIRALIKNVRTRLDDHSVKVVDIKEEILHMLEQVKEMIFKEENILIPLLNDTLNLYNFIKVDEASDEIGFFLEAPKTRWQQKEEATPSEESKPSEGEVPFDAGVLSFKEVNQILNTLPLDMTFVDKDGHVKYFSQGKERIFDRPLTILGRHVNMCHPPQSVHVVEKIVDAFKEGKKDHEDFWIQMRNNFIHIRYFAIRDKAGEYLGTLEVTQNIKPLRALEGEKRLLDDDY
ncbi:MAG: DUF438 domain-containing protein [Candidatus Izemoplasmataceae bacterium]